mmetsp:Transcript_35068/g.62681  ORF Transcript_35068/g.62681 Transcript_35068/m.62681 type:complete len:323 (+) Transcript_35068:369-1337(+)
MAVGGWAVTTCQDTRPTSCRDARPQRCARRRRLGHPLGLCGPWAGACHTPQARLPGAGCGSYGHHRAQVNSPQRPGRGGPSIQCHGLGEEEWGHGGPRGRPPGSSGHYRRRVAWRGPAPSPAGTVHLRNGRPDPPPGRALGAGQGRLGRHGLVGHGRGVQRGQPLRCLRADLPGRRQPHPLGRRAPGGIADGVDGPQRRTGEVRRRRRRVAVPRAGRGGRPGQVPPGSVQRGHLRPRPLLHPRSGGLPARRGGVRPGARRGRRPAPVPGPGSQAPCIPGLRPGHRERRSGGGEGLQRRAGGGVGRRAAAEQRRPAGRGRVRG